LDAKNQRHEQQEAAQDEAPVAQQETCDPVHDVPSSRACSLCWFMRPITLSA
jgi:hypothetical protein